MLARDSCISMHEAKLSRAKVEADNRTGGSIFRAAISSASNQRTSRLWARAALFEPLGWLKLHPSSILRFRGGSSGTRRAFCGSGADSSGTHRAFCGSGADSIGTFRVFCGGGLERPFRAICGPGAGSSGHFEPSAAPGRARAAILAEALPPPPSNRNVILSVTIGMRPLALRPGKVPEVP